MPFLSRLVSLAAIAVGGCGIADFDLSQPIPEQRVEGSGIPAPIAGLFPIPVSLDLSAEIAKRNSGPIDRISLASIELTITPTAQPPGDTDDWAFVDAIDVFVRSSQPGSTLPRVQIAQVRDPGPVTTLAFDVDGSVDLKPYVDEGSVVESEARGAVPADDVSYAGETVFTIHPL